MISCQYISLKWWEEELIVFMISFSSLFFWHNKHQTVGGGSVFLLLTHERACTAVSCVSFPVSKAGSRVFQLSPLPPPPQMIMPYLCCYNCSYSYPLKWWSGIIWSKTSKTTCGCMEFCAGMGDQGLKLQCYSIEVLPRKW